MVTIRAMTGADVPAVSEIRVLGWRWAYEGLVPGSYLDAMNPAQDAARRREFFAASRGRVHNLLAVVPDGGAPVGAGAGPGTGPGAGPEGGTGPPATAGDSKAGAGGGAREGAAGRERVVGWAASGPYRGEPDAAADGELYALYLRPEWAGRGVGRALMSAVVEQAAAQGRERLLLWVLAGNARARRFYAAAGFAPDGAEAADVFDGVSLREVRYARDLAYGTGTGR